jgi:hypothetical protein
VCVCVCVRVCAQASSAVPHHTKCFGANIQRFPIINNATKFESKNNQKIKKDFTTKIPDDECLKVLRPTLSSQ